MKIDVFAKGDGVTDDSAAFTKVQQAAYIKLTPGRTYKVDSTIQVQSGQIIDLRGATIVHGDPNTDLFACNAVDDWQIIGGTIIGAGTTGTGNGIHATGCKGGRVTGTIAKSFKAGFKLTAGTYRSPLARQVKFIDVQAYDNYVGTWIEAGSGAEYSEFIGLVASGNYYGAFVRGGNTQFTGGALCENTVGISYRDGHNHAHGIVNGVNINHNSSYNIECENITYGQTFNGCHVYGDSPTQGIIKLLNSKGIRFVGGVISSCVVQDGADKNYAIGVYATGQAAVAGANPASFVRLNCPTDAGAFW